MQAQERIDEVKKKAEVDRGVQKVDGETGSVEYFGFFLGVLMGGQHAFMPDRQREVRLIQV